MIWILGFAAAVALFGVGWAVGFNEASALDEKYHHVMATPQDCERLRLLSRAPEMERT